MKKVELLSPVGNMESMYQAIHNGADAIYLAGTKFGARKYADNFTNADLDLVIKYAHLYGVKVYITVNTMIYGNELNEVYDYLLYIHTLGVDAVIVQDIGIIKMIHDRLPNLEVHASTQCHNHNNDGINLLKELGVTRVVFDREMSLQEINNITNDIEKEIFVYGSLCVCYSGNCLFSSLNGGRSGNRGECVGSCRLPYKLVENDKELSLPTKYLLSMKDLNTISNLKEILDSNITSLKIEGRMKSPYYVGYVTKVYRTLIDKYYNNEALELTQDEELNLKKLFNRKYTKGFLFNDTNVANTSSPNHIGVEIGKVINTDKNYIYISLTNDDLNQEDGIRFNNSNKGMIVNKLYNKNKLLTNHIAKSNIALLDNKFKVRIGEAISKTIDNKLIQSLKNYIPKKINITFNVKAKLNKPLEITIDDSNNKATEYGSKITTSINKPTSKETITEKLSKLGNTPFILKDINIEIDDNIFINLSELNNIRRILVDKLIALRENNKKEVIINNQPTKLESNTSNNITINFLVRREDQLKACLSSNIDNIYLTDYNLYQKYKQNNIYYRLPRVNNTTINYINENLLVPDLGTIYKYSKNNNIISDYHLNIANSISIDLLNNYNTKKITLSVEHNLENIKNIPNKKNIEIIIYGHIELMIMKYCPLKELLHNCSMCKNNHNKYYLKSTTNDLYPIIHNNCLTTIIDSKYYDKIKLINDYLKNGFTNLRVDLFDENANQTKIIINKIKELINNENKNAKI